MQQDEDSDNSTTCTFLFERNLNPEDLINDILMGSFLTHR